MKTTIFNILVLLMLIPINAAGADAPKKPDFAYPKTVAQNARKQLAQAIKSGDDIAMLRAVIDLSLAETEIDADSINNIIARIEKIESNETSPDIKSLLNILLADIYSNVYQNARWKYDNRSLPTEPLPANITEWSGQQFKDKISVLCDSALSYHATLKTKPLKSYDDIITGDAHTFEFYPTLYDFIASQAIASLNQFVSNQQIFPISWCCRFDLYEQLQFRYTDSTARRILEIYQELLKFHEGDPAPFVITDVNRIGFISNHIYESDSSAFPPAYDTLLNLYLLLGKSQYAGEALIAIPLADYTGNEMRSKAYLAEIAAFLSRHPTYFRADILRTRQAQITRKSIEVSSAGTILPGASLDVKAIVNNTNKYSLGIFRVPYNWNGDDQYIARRNTEPAVHIKTLDYNIDGSAPFSATDTVKVSFDTPGCYIIVPAIGDNTPQINPNEYYQRIHCTALSIATASFGSGQWAWVINPATGAPVDAAKLQLARNGNTGKSFVTDADGKADLSKVEFPNFNWSLYAAKKDDKYADRATIYRRQAVDSIVRTNVNLWTDLAIYHPGDTLRFSGVLYTTQGKNHNLLKSESLTVELRDAGYQVKSTASFVTDEWGRFEGSFVLPSEGLTGNFHIVAKFGNNEEQSASFMVSDYKLPTYQMEISEILRNTPDAGAVTLKGKAVTYSGFPLAGIDVAVNLSVSQRFWWWNSRWIEYQSLTTVTDSDGTFSITFPAEMLAQSPIADGVFSARITATSSTGESREVSTRFSLGASYHIVCGITDGSDIDVSQPVRLNLRVTDLMDKPCDKTVHYSLIDGDKTIKEGAFPPSNPTVDWSKVPCGNYSIRLTLDSDDQARPEIIQNIGLYRPNDPMPPKSEPIWIPITSYTLKDSRTASILYGTSTPGGYVNYTVWTADSIYSQEWLQANPGMHHLTINLPDNVDEVTVSMMATADYRSTRKDITVRTESSLNSIAIEAESFRDRITPGAEETWTFRIKDRSGNGAKAAVMFDMYSKALDALAPQSWNFYVADGATNHFVYNTDIARRYSQSIRDNNIRMVKVKSITSPKFQMWDLSIGPKASMMIRGAQPVFKSANTLSTDLADTAMEESAVAYSAYGGTAMENSDSNIPEFSYRSSETPLAFFRPMLTTADDGSLEFSFTAPNANTTWQFCTLAFTPDLLTATMSQEVLSNKPVMAQPNLPRFLRTGDRAQIRASVMNNSDSVQIITTIVEIFDPASSNVTNRWQQTDTIAAGASAIVATDIDAPIDTNMLGYRIKSSTGNFADGEQSIIPILPASTPVIDSMPFYIAPDETSFSVQLPEEMPSDARITLEFCENPIWYCVTALPGLRTESTRTSMGAAAELFSAAVAEGILRSNPAIARAIRQWKASDKADSTLTSMLERNSDLKTILLSSTPWMMDARSDSERMARLATLFNKKEIDAVYSHAIHRLAQLQRDGGGWAWIDENDETSSWTTYNILSHLGHLKHLGFLPDNDRLTAMIANAVQYIDTKAVADYKKTPSADFTLYVAVRDLFPDIKQSTAAARVTRATVQRLVSDWKDRDIHGKALAALILNANGYNATARQVLASLREYAVYSPQRGLWWPSLDNTDTPFEKLSTASLALDAFHTIEPQSAETDQIRQWLILQKEAENWGTSAITSDIIASILLSGSDWTRPSTPAVVKVGDRKIAVDKTDNLLGYFRTPLSPEQSAGRDLTVAKAAGSPAWGAVYCQYRDLMTHIEAASCDAVEIEKTLLVQHGTEWIVADTIAVGDRVRVQLTIRATRDMDYVAITDDRAACFEPVEQLPRPIFAEGICFYRENRDASTAFFVTRLPKGTYQLHYDLFANTAGTYASSLATIQSQYAPALTAHSSGTLLHLHE